MVRFCKAEPNPQNKSIMKDFRFLLAVAMLFGGLTLAAQDAVLVEQEEDENPLLISGFVDAYYQFNFKSNSSKMLIIIGFSSSIVFLKHFKHLAIITTVAAIALSDILKGVF